MFWNAWKQYNFTTKRQSSPTWNIQVRLQKYLKKFRDNVSSCLGFQSFRYEKNNSIYLHGLSLNLKKKKSESFLHNEEK